MQTKTCLRPLAPLLAGACLAALAACAGAPTPDLTVPAALDATWAREEADRLVLLVDEDGRLKCKAANQKATRLAPADVTENGKQPIVGAAVLMFQRGDKLLGFTKHVADTICSEWL